MRVSTGKYTSIAQSVNGNECSMTLRNIALFGKEVKK